MLGNRRHRRTEPKVTTLLSKVNRLRPQGAGARVPMVTGAVTFGRSATDVSLRH